MTHWKRILFSAVVAVAVLFAVPGALRAQSGQVAVVNTNQILSESAAGVAAAAQFETYATERQQPLVNMQNEINQKTQELQAQQIALSPEALRQKNAELEALNRQFTREQEDYQADMTAKQSELLDPVVTLADEVLSVYAAEQGFRVILDVAALAEGGIVYLDPLADVTTELIRRMDARTATADPAAAAPALPPSTTPAAEGATAAPAAGQP